MRTLTPTTDAEPRLPGLMDEPCVQVTVTRRDLGYTDDPIKHWINASATLSMPEFMAWLKTLLSKQGWTPRLCLGNADTWRHLIAATAAGDSTAVTAGWGELLDDDAGLVLELPWTEWGRCGALATKLLDTDYRNLVSKHCGLQWGCLNITGDSGSSRLQVLGALTRSVVRLTATTDGPAGVAEFRLSSLSTDLWFENLNQGIRVSLDGVLSDLSSDPMGTVENQEQRAAITGFALRRARGVITVRNTRPELTLAGNILYNEAIKFVDSCFTQVHLLTWGPRKDFLENRVKSNVPLAALIGHGTGIRPDGNVCILMNETPAEAYTMFKKYSGFGRNLRWQGYYVPPTQEAMTAGTTTLLQLAGHRTHAAKRYQRRGYLVYDPDTATDVQAAIEIPPGLPESYALLDNYLAWYKDLKQTAIKRLQDSGWGKQKFGRWGFKPFTEAGYPQNARLYVNFVEE